MIKKVVLKPLTSFSEMFSADQLWGQMIWAISDLYGNDVASKAVKEFIDNPPFLLSSLLIDGYLFKPFYVDILGDIDSEIVKHNKKCKWLSYDDFLSLQMNPMYLSEHKISKQPSPLIMTNEIHASISRDSLEVLDGGLFNASYIYSDTPLCFYIYSKDLSNEWDERINRIIKYWEKIGLGGDKNIGHGQFKISVEELSYVEKSIFEFRTSSFFVSLSECSGSDFSPINYSLDVYSGVLGRNKSGAYRKNPIIRFKAGSLFLEGKGAIVEEVGSDSACSYGYAFPIFMKYEEK